MPVASSMRCARRRLPLSLSFTAFTPVRAWWERRLPVWPLVWRMRTDISEDCSMKYINWKAPTPRRDGASFMGRSRTRRLLPPGVGARRCGRDGDRALSKRTSQHAGIGVAREVDDPSTDADTAVLPRTSVQVHRPQIGGGQRQRALGVSYERYTHASSRKTIFNTTYKSIPFYS